MGNTKVGVAKNIFNKHVTGKDMIHKVFSSLQ